MPDPGPPRGARRSGSATPSMPRSNGARAEAARTPADDLLERLLLREGLAGEPEAFERGRALVDGWLESELCAELATAPSVQPRSRFVLGLGGTVVRGQIDLLARGTGGAAASSTTRPTRCTAAARPSSATATERSARSTRSAAGDRRGARVAHVFLEAPAEPVTEELGGSELGARTPAPGGVDRANGRRRIRARRRSHRGAVLRLSRGGAALSSPGQWKPSARR